MIAPRRPTTEAPIADRSAAPTAAVRFHLDTARLLAPGIVVAVATSTLEAPTGPLRGVNHSRMTAVIADQGGRWAITVFHNTLVTEDI